MATWDNLENYLRLIYGSQITEIFQRLKPQLASRTFAEIENTGATSFAAANALGKQDPRYVTAQNLPADATLWQFRAFLYNDLRLTELYSGDGLAQLHGGGVGVREYFHLHLPIDQIADQVVIDL